MPKDVRAALARAEKARAAAVEEEKSLVAAGGRQGKSLQDSFHRGRSKQNVRIAWVMSLIGVIVQSRCGRGMPHVRVVPNFVAYCGGCVWQGMSSSSVQHNSSRYFDARFNTVRFCGAHVHICLFVLRFVRNVFQRSCICVCSHEHVCDHC